MQKKILIVDDEKGILSVMERTLKKINEFNISISSDCKEALFLLTAPWLNNFDLLITDVHMDINGLTLIKKAKETNPKIKTIAMSGKFIPKKKENEFDYFLSKPFNINDLRKAVNKVISG